MNSNTFLGQNCTVLGAVAALKGISVFAEETILKKLHPIITLEKLHRDFPLVDNIIYLLRAS